MSEQQRVRRATDLNPLVSTHTTTYTIHLWLVDRTHKTMYLSFDVQFVWYFVGQVFWSRIELCLFCFF